MGGHWGQRGLRGHWGHTNLKTMINDSRESLKIILNHRGHREHRENFNWNQNIT
ncbi:MAG: hypothetical protein LBB88_12120 [Planctomycetaceae bacterium]|nr:hypothetical protein [Planctomycetaceae bacterium]